MRNLLKYIFKIIKSKLQTMSSGHLYVLVMNITSKKGVRYQFKKSYYLVSDSGIQHYFIKSRGHHYAKGLRERTLDLVNSYNIHKVDFQSDDLIVDVGANMGDLINFFPNQRYIGFEPSPEEFKILEKNKKLNCKAYNLCIGDEEKEIDFFISSAGADSSIYKPSNVEKIIKIKQHRLDNLINEPIKLLKIDAEGAELEVINGSLGILSLTKFIAIDLGFEKGVNQESTAPAVFKVLNQHNFELIEIAKNERFLFKNSSK